MWTEINWYPDSLVARITCQAPGTVCKWWINGTLLSSSGMARGCHRLQFPRLLFYVLLFECENWRKVFEALAFPPHGTPAPPKAVAVVANGRQLVPLTSQQSMTFLWHPAAWSDPKQSRPELGFQIREFWSRKRTEWIESWQERTLRQKRRKETTDNIETFEQGWEMIVCGQLSAKLTLCDVADGKCSTLKCYFICAVAQIRRS